MMKEMILSFGLGLSLLSASGMTAAAVQTVVESQPKIQTEKSKLLLTEQQRAKMRLIRKELHQKLIPLCQERKALKHQLKKTMSLPQARWEDISPILDKLNATNGKIIHLIKYTQFTTFRQFGVQMPLKTHYRCFVGH